MEISLIRHGKSKLTENDKIIGLKFKRWVEKYNESGVFAESSYPSNTLEKVTSTNIVITSHLKRSVESANVLNAAAEVISDSLFRETELPSIPSLFDTVMLKPSSWATILRIGWFCGYSNKCESLKEAKCRAFYFR